MDYRSRYPALLRYLSQSIDIFLVCGGVIVLLLIFSNAVLRGAAGFDLAWSLEITAFLLLWLTFLGCAAATARGAHMRVTEIVENLVPLRLQSVLQILINLVITVILVTVLYNGSNIALHTWAQKTTVLYWPVGLLYASLPIGMLFTLIFHLYNCLVDVQNISKNIDGGISKSDDHSWEDFE
ncbi:TRAP transporter small permease [uncultured Kiloniella sp.]|uniref:TRAP transporter small permease n=1 Tax=uncultured Kiloniella sp. TaxID=1133091 RepID=UPI0026242EF1|nr:TRAP transporter small permease [uncultured Kiloniella sp.]